MHNDQNFINVSKKYGAFVFLISNIWLNTPKRVICWSEMRKKLYANKVISIWLRLLTPKHSKGGFFSESGIRQISKKIFQKTILSLKFKFQVQDSFLEYIFLEIWKTHCTFWKKATSSIELVHQLLIWLHRTCSFVYKKYYWSNRLFQYCARSKEWSSFHHHFNRIWSSSLDRSPLLYFCLLC